MTGSAGSSSSEGSIKLSVMDTAGKLSLDSEASKAPALALLDDPDAVKNSECQAGWMEASVHLVTTMYGAGVLGLPYALASLGWWAGTFLLLFVILESAYSAYLLATLHELRDGRRIKTLRGLAQETLGRWGQRVVVGLQFFIMVGSAIVLSVAAGSSILNMVHNCSGSEGQACAAHEFTTWPWTVLFGGCMIVLAQFPSFHDLAIVSLVGSFMPIIYSGIALVSMLVHGPQEERDYSIIRGTSDFKTAMSVLGGVGSLFFAFGGQVVQNEVTATLSTPPSIMTSMKRALTVAYVLIGVGYFSVAIVGYAFFGNAVTGNVMQSLPYAVPSYVANVCVVLHVAAAYQVLSMPVYHAIERRVKASRFWSAKRGSGLLLRLCVRSTYVALCTLLAAAIPFFSELGGLIGGLGVVPLCAVFPLIMWQVYNRQYVGRLQTAVNWGLVAALLAVAGATTFASLERIVDQASTFQLFA